MNIAVGSDHAGVRLKQAIAEFLRKRGHTILDKGTYDRSPVDYPDPAHAVGQSVASGEVSLGVLCCGSGIGVSIAANKVPGVRAAVVSEPVSARLARQHNDVQVLCLGERVLGESLALECVSAWLEATFEGGRHQRRVNKIETI